MVIAIDPVVDGGFVKTVEVAYRQLLVQHLKKRIVTAQRCDCSLIRPWSVFEVFVLQLVKTEKIVLPKLRQVGRVESVEKGRKKLFRRLVQDEVGAVRRISIWRRGGVVRVCHGYNTASVCPSKKCARLRMKVTGGYDLVHVHLYVGRPGWWASRLIHFCWFETRRRKREEDKKKQQNNKKRKKNCGGGMNGSLHSLQRSTGIPYQCPYSTISSRE